MDTRRRLNVVNDHELDMRGKVEELQRGQTDIKMRQDKAEIKIDELLFLLRASKASMGIIKWLVGIGMAIATMWAVVRTGATLR